VVASTATGGERAFDERAVVNAHGVRRGGAAIGDAVHHGGARFWRRRHQRGRGHRFEWWSCPRLVASGGLRRLSDSALELDTADHADWSGDPISVVSGGVLAHEVGGGHRHFRGHRALAEAVFDDPVEQMCAEAERIAEQWPTGEA